MNEEFANRLMTAKNIVNQTERLEVQVKNAGAQIAADTIYNMGPGRYKTHQTSAAMMAFSVELRTAMPRPDLEAFDRIVAAARSKLLEMQNTKPQGVKIIQAINRILSDPIL